MGTTTDTGQAPTELNLWLDRHEAELSAQLQLALRATMFSNRFEMRPAQFGRVAAEEARALRDFIAQHDLAAASARGGQLCRKGLGEESILRLAQTTRRFFLNSAPDELRLQALEETENYHSAIVSGFMAAHTALTLEEQERIRSAIQRTVSRYAVQMAVAAEVARAATSILDLDELLQTASELIRTRFNLYYVAMFLIDGANRWAYLQASSGESGQIMLRRGHRLKIGGDSLVGWCIAHGEARIALDVGEKAISFDTPLLTDIHSEMVIPLISRGKVIGAMAVQSRQVNAFTEQDVSVIRITADQLANAIANARLFGERERQIGELSALNEMSRSLSAALDFDTLLQTVHQQVGRFYDASHFTIATCNPADNSWRLVYDFRDDRQLPVSDVYANSGLIGYIARQRQPLLLANRREQFVFRQIQAAEPFDSATRSWMGVPLIAANKVVGVMTLASTTQEDRYNERDLVFFTTIAAQVAIAMVNARLYEQLRKELLDRVRAAEELREAKEAAEGASKAKSTFLANMSHELRTPLTGIIGYSELLEKEAAHFGYNDFVPDLRKIRTAGTHLLAIINDILDLSKIESGKMQLLLETFDLAALLDEVQTTATPLIAKNRNVLELVIPPELGTIRSDLTRLRQIILNLLSNAAKFTEAGRVELRAARQQRGGAEWICVSIKDTGIGISPEQLSKLFQDFTQADASMTRRYGGTGLGLALSRRLCEMLGGEIMVDSELNIGSVFTVWFPAELSDPATAQAPQPEPPARPVASARPVAPEPAEASCLPESILVIDDDPNTCDLLARALAGCATRVVTAATGEEGLALARSLRPSVITLDVLLPGMDGWSVLAELKGNPELAEIPVVMVTVVDERDRGFVLGAADYLVKPIDSRRLIDVVRGCQAVGPRADPGEVLTLIVEDDEALRDILRRTLEQDGFQVITAANGRAALEQVAAQTPAVILLDLLLPELDGLQVISMLRAAPAWQDIPIVVMTASELTHEERSRLSRSVEQILAKGSFGGEELTRQVRKAVQAHQRLIASTSG